MLGRVEVHGGGRIGGEVLVQQAQVLFLAQHPFERAVHEGLAHPAIAHRLSQGPQIGVARGQLHVHAGGQGERGRLGQVRGDVVEHVQERHAEVVGHHHAVKAPFAAQQVGEQAGVRGDGHAVDLRIRVHDRPHAAVLDRHLEGDEHHVGDLARSGVHGREVAPRLRAGVAHKVFERGVHARAL